MNRFWIIFSQLLQFFFRIEFQQAVKETQAVRHARGFTCWGQFMAMLFCQVGRVHSLREITGGLRSCEGELKRLGIMAASHSTLAYANEHRPWQIYQLVFQQLLHRCQRQVTGKKKFRFENKMTSIDSAIIDLSVTLFDWAKFRRAKGAIKLHLLLDHDGCLASFAVITEGKVADVKMAPRFRFTPGTIVVYDRGYNDYKLFGRWTAQGVYFVTRMKENALYEVVGESPVPQNRHILKDERIEFRGPGAQEKCPYPVRLITAYDPETGKIFLFFTNNMDLGSTTIAAVYQDRWQIEIFFKALRQNLKIKTFVETRAHAVKIQIGTALNAMLVLRYLQLRSKFNGSLSNLVSLLRRNLFTHRDLGAWLDQPFEVLPISYEPEKLPLTLV